MKLTNLIIALSVLLTISAVASAQGVLKPREGQITEKADAKNALPAYLLKSKNNGSNHGSAKVAENVSVTLGPIGELYLVSGVNDYIKVDTNRESSYFYPSLIFDISASPL